MALSSKLRDAEIVVLDQFSLDSIKTKEAASMMDNISKLMKGYKKSKDKNDSILAVLPSKDRIVEKSLSNLNFVGLTEARNMNAYDTLKYKYILLAKDSVKGLQNNFK